MNVFMFWAKHMFTCLKERSVGKTEAAHLLNASSKQAQRILSKYTLSLVFFFPCYGPLFFLTIIPLKSTTLLQLVSSEVLSNLIVVQKETIKEQNFEQ